jgi:hypothetical protein
MKSQLVTMSLLAGLVVPPSPTSAAGNLVETTKVNASYAIDGTDMQKFFMFELNQEQGYVRTLFLKEQNPQRKKALQDHLVALRTLSERNEELLDPLRWLIRLAQEGKKLGTKDVESVLQASFESAKERMIQTRERAWLSWREWADKSSQTAWN